jgi:hypothetical protein
VIPDGRGKRGATDWNKMLSAESPLSPIRRVVHSPRRPFAATPSRPFVPHRRVRVLLARAGIQSPALAGNGLKQCGLDLLCVFIPKGFMKANKVPHERNPFLLTGKRRWRPFRWILRRTRRQGAANNLLSQDVKPA